MYAYLHHILHQPSALLCQPGVDLMALDVVWGLVCINQLYKTRHTIMCVIALEGISQAA
jgi:hypothetical protein